MVASAKQFVEPNVMIGTVEVQCHLQKVTLLAEVVSRTVIETYCNPGGEAPSAVRWTGTIRVLQSFGSDSAWEFFSELPFDETLDFTIFPSDPGTAGASSDNPSATFEAYLDPIGFIPDHEVGGAGYFDLAFTVVGTPTFDDTP